MNYSIIIPHYNNLTLLKKCIRSIPKREDIEIIVIDDCSNENNRNFTDLTNEYTNLRVKINPENRGAGYARNIGLSYADGLWIIFCDADDYFLPSFDSKLTKYIYDDSDIIYFNITSTYSINNKQAIRHLTVSKLIENSYKNKHHLNMLKYTFLEPFSKFYKRKYLVKNKISFDEVYYSNDTMFSIKAALKTEKIKVDVDKIYCLTVTPNSLTNIVNENSLDVRLNVALKANKLLRENKLNKYVLSMLPFIIRAYNIDTYKLISVLWLLIKNRENFVLCTKDLIFKIVSKANPVNRYHSRLWKINKSASYE